MGCFGYICKGCGTPIRGNCWDGGEKCIMIHVRNGKEVGRVEGHYNEYGGVIEQANLPENEKFRGDNEGINSHSEICKSEFSLNDSYEKLIEKRIYSSSKLGNSFIDKPVSFYSYVSIRICEEEIDHFNKLNESFLFKLLSKDIQDNFNKRLDTTITKNDKIKINADIYVAFEDLKYNEDTLLYKEFMALPKIELEQYSGLVVWHSHCYKKATDEQKTDLTPSLQDPNQSWGLIRKKYK